jgi:hypothetical protein
MENSIQKFDANAAMNSVKEKIKDAFVSLIPDEQWKEMVQKEIDSYFVEVSESHDTRSRSSKFTKSVHESLSEEVKARVKAYLTGPDFNTMWLHNGVPKCSAAVEQMIAANAGKILSDMIGGHIAIAVGNAGYRL